MPSLGLLLNVVFWYHFVNTGIFAFQAGNMVYIGCNRHALVSVNDIIADFGSFSAALLPIQEDCTQV